jgi:hypothetical protein
MITLELEIRPKIVYETRSDYVSRIVLLRSVKQFLCDLVFQLVENYAENRVSSAAPET